MLADSFAWNNVEDTIMFIQYLLPFRFKFGQLLAITIPSNLEVTIHPSFY